MAVPDGTTWEAAPHTLAKHEILKKYLQRWIPIILHSGYSGLIYFDGFCGPGVYAGGEPGSPIIALKVAQEFKGLHRDSNFLFCDVRRDRIETLKDEIAKLGELPEGVQYQARAGSFEDKISKIIAYRRQQESETFPTFALIDPFGYSGIPLALIRELMAQDSSECLISFMADSLNRWLEHPEEGVTEHVAQTLGTENAAKIVLDTGMDRLGALRELYLAQLQRFAKYCRYFEMRNADGRILYYLFFISNNKTGFEKMKDAMWQADSSGNFRFSDSTDPDQEVLFDNEVLWLPIAKRRIQEEFGGKPSVAASKVRDFVLGETIFLEKHANQALRALEDEGAIQPHRLKIDGSNRRKRSFPEGVLIDF